MRDIVTVVAGSPSGEAYARRVLASLSELGIRTWSLDQVEAGESYIGSMDVALKGSVMLVLVATADSVDNDWASIQTHAFQAQVRLQGDLKIVVVPVGLAVLQPTLKAQAVVLSADLEPVVAAKLCAAMIHLNTDLSSFQAFPSVDNLNAPVLYASAWPIQPDLSLTYGKYVEAISSLVELEEYETAEALYWKILFYSGYRELWEDRLRLSAQLLPLSIKVRDAASSGNILTMGLAYAYLTRREFARAEHALIQAFWFSHRARDRRGEGKALGYMADAYAQTGRLNRALLMYDEAAERLQGIERRRIELKSLFLRARAEDLSPREQTSQLVTIRNEFASIYDYHAPLVDIEIAKRLYDVGDHSTALTLVQESARMFRLVIKMPRNAVVAEQLLLKWTTNLEEES